MIVAKPTSQWAVISAACSILGTLAGFALFVFKEQYQEIIRSSAGLGGIYFVGHGLAAALFCALGIFCGLVAETRIRGGLCGGQATALSGIVVGSLTLLLGMVWFCIVVSR